MNNPLDQRLQDCDKKINALFSEVEFNADIKKEVEELKAYYRKQYHDAVYEEDELECIEIYELFVLGLESIKKGEMKPHEVLQNIEDINSLKKKGIVLENILNSLELLFWAGVTCTFFSYCAVMAAPLAAFNPFFALAVLSIASMAAIFSIVQFLNCIDEFKSTTPVEKEFDREKNIITFFKNPQPSYVPSEDHTYPEKERLYPRLDLMN
ncbi:DUF5638 domain-containing protein [Fluoribacter dumoffii]|uniref:DUF5638 domain-containing protein n=1 Tax=Fluoribacter dumoffii TaxID=463 RepID=A0A377G944_9GAMM|nr:DUF5638 domain-containing protein [Fluoribacter dumoffii]KTC90216.1 hypothetical protein Ldum_1284 [Fluoribacter dumoffii NY 23]MCW8418562.1 DUF5638 domain-containing protein [Fluoribacter dumoffii]MCW8453596.1 DUF5638 domain-containing protein [Fluoribacter dumoffii]MCW8459186.1 DUF5638 domain-containing protein [Fluoribacter dumoffii]MCW8482545.1 DUF5638 domain-containing protein [Fluoribacter dumoffii]